MSLFNKKPRKITLEELEELLKEKDSDTGSALRTYIYNYKKEIANEEEKEKLALEHFKGLGIPEEALYSEIHDDINCQRLEYGIDNWNFDGKPRWYLDCQASLWISPWDCNTLLDVLVAIENETNQRIVKFGLDDLNRYATNDGKGRVHYGKIKRRVYLSECNDSFNLKLSDGRYFHLYFCESK